MPARRLNPYLLTDARGKLLVLVFLSTAHIIAGRRTTWLILCIVGTIAWLERATLRRLRRVVAVTMTVVALVCTLIWFIASAGAAWQVTIDLARLMSLAVVTMVLVFSMSILELAAALRRLRIPKGLVLSFAVGLRFLPVVGEELERIGLVRRQRALTFRSLTRRFGAVGAVSRLFSPLIVAMFRRVDAILLAVHVRGLTERIEQYVFRPMPTLDRLVVILAILTMMAAMLDRIMM